MIIIICNIIMLKDLCTLSQNGRVTMNDIIISFSFLFIQGNGFRIQEMVWTSVPD